MLNTIINTQSQIIAYVDDYKFLLLTTLPAMACLLLMSRPNGIREEIERIWAANDIAPHMVADVNAPALLIEAVQAGLGFGVLPSCAIDQKLLDGSMDAVQLSGATPKRIVCLATSMLFPISQATQRVHDLLRKLMRDAVEQGRWQAVLVGDDDASASLS